MESFPAYYTILFNGVTDAIAAIDRQDFGLARELLVRGQQRAEDAYIEAGETGPAGTAEPRAALPFPEPAQKARL